MASPAELTQQIRFGLDTLQERNAHHEFEQLCLGLARRRITSNLVPATGPVSAAGDQGRDAESHWTALPKELPGTSLFVSLASLDKVVVACTTQKEGRQRKIREDLAAITAGPDQVDRVVYFISSSLPVGKRHALQAEAISSFGIALDVWDAVAIAEHLADPDLFYLAVQHLQIPSSLAPAPPPTESDLPEWYLADRDRWRTRAELGGSLGELVDLRRPLRHATFHTAARSDLPDWIAIARRLVTAARSDDVRLRGDYEISVATLRGLDTLRPVDDTVRTFFQAVPAMTDLGLLEDALILQQYSIGAYARGITTIAADEVDSWRETLEARVDFLLSDDPYPNARAHLLALRARLALSVKTPPNPIDYVRDDLPPVSEVTANVLARLEAGESLTLPTDLDDAVIDIDKGMATLLELCAQLTIAPTFPVDHTVDLFTFLAPALANHPSYKHVRDALDEAVERIEGTAARADRAQDRAVAFLQSGQVLKALHEVHTAKLNWWHGDTLEGALTMMLLASRIYSDLGLHIAAKHYAVGAAGAAHASQNPELSRFTARGFILAATYDYLAGQWLTATRTFRVGVYAQGALADDPWSFERYEYFMHMCTYQAFIKRTASSLRPTYLELIDRTMHSTSLNTIVDPLVDHVKHLPGMTENEAIRAAEEDLLGRPFSDAGPVRRYRWNALGLTWTVEVRNTRVEVLAAERFIAATQIVLAELAGADPQFLPGAINVQIRADASHDPPSWCEELPDNSSSRWRVHLLGGHEVDDDGPDVQVTTAVTTILLTRTTMSADLFMDTIERAFEQGLWHKLAAGRPYDEAAGVLDLSDYVEMSDLEPGLNTDDALVLHPHPELEPVRGRDSTYDQEQSLATVQSRYDNLMPMVQHTLPRLLTDPQFRSTVRKLRNEGWLDWHLLTAIANHAANRRAALRGHQPRVGMTIAEREELMAAMTSPEQSSDPILDVDEFDEETLRRSLAGAAMSTATMLGLEIHQRTPDLDAIFEYLDQRFGYWSDDVAHPDYFSWN